MAGTPQHATLVAATATTITFDFAFDSVEVVNVDGTSAVYFTVDGTEPEAVEEEGCHVLPAAISSVLRDVPTLGVTVVNLISAGTPKVSVSAFGPRKPVVVEEEEE